jgi:carboxyl-terminal processing protease
MAQRGIEVNVKRVAFPYVATLVLAMFGSPRVAAQQQMSKQSRESAETMLQNIATDINKHYYDPKFHGLDWDAVVAQTKQKIDKSDSFDMALLHIAALVDALNDSHTTLFPPRKVLNSPAYVRDWRALLQLTDKRHDYGWRSEIIGERCFVTHVRPGSDAEKKGLHVGEELLSMNGYRPERASIQRAEYVFNVLRPQDELKVEVIDPTGTKKQLTVAAKVQQVMPMSQLEQGERAIHRSEDLERISKPRLAEFGDDLAILKLSDFYLTFDAAQGWIDKARKHKALIIDLRDNHGGAEETLQHLLGGLFDHEVKMGDRVMRNDRKPLMAKPLHSFEGKIIVLIDSNSKSASEIFSRVVQLEKRGLVMGDRSAGSVMEARYYPYQLFGSSIYYGVSITQADLIMADGKSLEHVGVTPDEVMVPTASDLAKGLDPVLAHAADTLGVKLSPEQAGKLFPYEWPPE